MQLLLPKPFAPLLLPLEKNLAPWRNLVINPTYGGVPSLWSEMDQALSLICLQDNVALGTLEV